VTYKKQDFDLKTIYLFRLS